MFGRAALIVCLSGCYLQSYPVTPKVAAESTFQLDATDSQGTAWAVASHYLITAGHMCNDNDGRFVVHNATRTFRAESIAWVQNPAYVGDEDLCLLKTQATLMPLLINPNKPRVGAIVSYTGYPNGVWDHGEGHYLGDTDGPLDNADDNDVDIKSADHGASGAAVYTANGVVGVLVRCRQDKQVGSNDCREPDEGFTFVSGDRLRSFLLDNSVHFIETPSTPADGVFGAE